ncbi:hypothetical protein ANN_16464 [Periplaneta americana]|uniref:Uncharacterized protein n=1 Tax=Periplaneta americana TaxID=6978 RepID=A0ABQ8SJ22_PERAM|nr:hypothetical protein ANN_16464 [Periplaneta americana]
MAALCEGGNKPSGSLKAICKESPVTPGRNVKSPAELSVVVIALFEIQVPKRYRAIVSVKSAAERTGTAIPE